MYRDEDDWMPIWARRRRYPYPERSIFDDIEEQIRETFAYMQREFHELVKRAPKDLHQTRVLSDGSKVEEWGPFVYGYTIKIGPNGKPQIQEFGNIKRQLQLGNRAAVDVKKEREPLIDMTVTDYGLEVIAELPGVDKNDIKIYGTEDTLTISVENPERSYYKEIELPRKVATKEARSTFKNGVLKVTLPLQRNDQPKGESIRID